MPYAIVKVVNGNYAVHAECGNKKQAMVNYHSLCAALWNDAGTHTATVRVVDQTLNAIVEETIINPSEQAAE